MLAERVAEGAGAAAAEGPQERHFPEAGVGQEHRAPQAQPRRRDIQSRGEAEGREGAAHGDEGGSAQAGEGMLFRVVVRFHSIDMRFHNISIWQQFEILIKFKCTKLQLSSLTTPLNNNPGGRRSEEGDERLPDKAGGGLGGDPELGGGAEKEGVGVNTGQGLLCPGTGKTM